ncbi:hypothetical protein ID866_8758 [Astraeus odoratus]|nr:hypothetical protein ID866_8758 [Astraeus odoratus]
MFRAAAVWALCLSSVFVTLCHSAQLPLTTGPECSDHTRNINVEGLRTSRGGLAFYTAELDRLTLDEPPNINSTGHLVFETVNSLLQHWPNTRMRNGHTIVPGIVRPGTLIYHGTSLEKLPTGPEWAAFDPEHSFLFCKNAAGEDGCWHLTLITTRPLKVLYFDGSSAANMPFGTMDAQDIVAWGEMKPAWAIEERKRIKDLCTWGWKYDIHGFVSEIMLCNFTSGLSVLSFLNLANTNPQLYRTGSPRLIEAINAGTWHNNYPGLNRIQLDLSGLISFYDTDLVPSLVTARFLQERWDHRLQNISEEDIARVTARLDEILTRSPGHPTSGIDWIALIRTVVDRYSERLELIRRLLNSTEDWDSQNVIDCANKTQTQLRAILTPYILSTVMPPRSYETFSKRNRTQVSDWAKPVFALCTRTHTDMPIYGVPMTDSEWLLLNAVQETTQEICRVITNMWTSGVLAGVDSFLSSTAGSEASVDIIRTLTKTWRIDLSGLMQWLDWNTWVKCNPACGPEEMCYLTTWPAGFPLSYWPDPTKERYSPTPVPTQPGHFPRDPPPGSEVIADDWKRPHPRCVQRIDPRL